MLTQERLKELLVYDPATGVFRWTDKAPRKSNIGRVAGHYNFKQQAMHILVDKQIYTGGRLAVFYMTGLWPEFKVRHINGIEYDNSWQNLKYDNGKK